MYSTLAFITLICKGLGNLCLLETITIINFMKSEKVKGSPTGAPSTSPTNTIKVYYSRIKKRLPAFQWNNLLLRIPQTAHKNILKYKFWIDQHRALYGRLLIQKALEKYGYGPSVLSHLQFTEYGRPWIDRKVDFNLSHSGDWVILAITERSRLGIDIEQIRDIKLEYFKNIMTPTQWKQIYSAANSIREFFRFWAMKESVIKANGKGLSIPLDEVEGTFEKVVVEGDHWYLKEILIDDKHSTFVCGENENFGIELEKLVF